MPEVPIVDAHVHLWDPAHFRQPWLDGNDLLNRPYELTAFGDATAGLPVEGLVYVQTDVATVYALLEARWAASLAAQDARVQAIVPYAPLEFGERARAFLEALVETSPLIKGVRRIYQDEDEAFCLHPAFVRGVQLLAEYGLTCDLCLRYNQLANTVALVRQCPDTSFVVDHLAKPAIVDHAPAAWRQHLQELGALPNVVCKISGVVTEADHRTWVSADVQPYIEHALEVFGEDRVLFGSDWPVVLLASTYRRWVDTLDDLTTGLPRAARAKLWAENARRVYRIVTPAS